ncbi:T9SS type A sorting domain-containing protein [bacterium]|nr:T9SS type A sorting domain-containing protein [bacterium]
MRTRNSFCMTLLILVVSVSLTNAQSPDSLWSRTYGGNDWDYCLSMEQTSDGGYVLAGVVEPMSTYSADFWMVKTGENGDSLWCRAYGDQNSDWCYSVHQTADGGYALAGYTESLMSGRSDFLLLKTDENGDSLWSRTYGGLCDDYCQAAAITSDGGYLLVGMTINCEEFHYDFFILKTDANGDSLWSRTYGGSRDDVCSSVAQTSDGGYILGGWTNSFGPGMPWSNNFWLIKTDANGDSLWSRIYGGRDDDECYSVLQTSDGGYVSAGVKRLSSPHWPDPDMWIIKMDANGDSLWSRTFGKGGSEECHCVRQTEDGGYILAGYTNSYGARSLDFWLVRLDEHGERLWARTLGGGGGDVGYSVVQTSDGGYAVAGYTFSFGNGGSDFWLVKMGPELSAEPSENLLPRDYVLHQNYPNPFNPITEIVYEMPRAGNVSLRVFDILGREVATLSDGQVGAGVHQVRFDGSYLPSGIYFYYLRVENFTSAKKMLLLK